MTLLLLCAPIALLLTLLADVSVFVALSSRRTREHAPAITILKPVKGDEPGLHENLASLATQDYPAVQLVIGAEDPRDPALAIAREVQRQHPLACITVHAGARQLGLNPKVNLLAALAAHARHDHLLISDSNVRARPTYLRETACELGDPRVGLVTNALAGCGSGTAAVLENLHLGGFVASAGALTRVAAGRACVIGKSMLFRRSDLERLGGFGSVADVLAEDYVLGRKYELAGFRVALSRHVLTAVHDGWTLDRFVNRHLRWAQMRRRLSPLAFAAEPLLNPLPWLLAVALVLPERAGLCALLALCKLAADSLVARRLRGSWLTLPEIALVPVKDLLVAALWLCGAFRRTVCWRGRLMRIEQGSRLAELPALQEAA